MTWNTLGFLFYDLTRLYLLPNRDLGKEVFFDFHDAPMVGHRGPKVTMKAISKKYYCSGLLRDVGEYIRTCTTCQVNKHSTQKRSRLLRLLPIPPVPFKSISMDFMMGLPPYEPLWWDAIMVIIDRFNKVARFLPNRRDSPTYGVKDVVNIFFDQWVCLYGLPQDNISDCDHKFTLTFWQQVMTRASTRSLFTTSFHPEGDGHTERTNVALNMYLRNYIA